MSLSSLVKKPRSLPEFFAPLFWSFRFDSIDIRKHKKTIIVQTINYGSWEQWKWIAETYGKEEIAREIARLSETELRKEAAGLARIIFDTENYENTHRSAHLGRKRDSSFS